MTYEFVPGDEIVLAPGRTLKRIRALVAIEALGVTPGTIGGYVESSNNLSGDARVYGNAQVYGDGLVFWASKVGAANGTFTAYNTKGNSIEITRGCFRGSSDEFLRKSKAEHDDQTHLEYRLLVQVAQSRITRALAATTKPMLVAA